MAVQQTWRGDWQVRGCQLVANVSLICARRLIEVWLRGSPAETATAPGKVDVAGGQRGLQRHEAQRYSGGQGAVVGAALAWVDVSVG
jgi:hypothetical protein